MDVLRVKCPLVAKSFSIWATNQKQQSVLHGLNVGTTSLKWIKTYKEEMSSWLGSKNTIVFPVVHRKYTLKPAQVI